VDHEPSGDRVVEGRSPTPPGVPGHPAPIPPRAPLREEARRLAASLEPAMARRLGDRIRRVAEGRLRGPRARHAVEQARWEVEAIARRRSMPLDLTPPPADLPIAAVWSDLAEAIRRRRVVVVRGETGSGKSTQIPRIAASLGFGIEGRIVVTQPRRIAARAIAARIAAECKVELGGGVGYRTRFEDRTSPATRIEVATDGVLAARLGHDPLLRGCEVVVIDEAHERSLVIDLLLGALRRATRRRDDLRVVISSATLAAEPIAAFFDGAPILDVPGRRHPVEILHRPIEEPGDADAEAALLEAMASGIGEVLARQGGEPGDVLAFLPSTRAIDDLAELLGGRLAERATILPLHARLDAAAQDAAFRAPKGPRVILATNVAETSLTLPWVRSVVDSGLARVRRYDPRRRIARLRIEPISRASAAQRAGRCGRVGPGTCLRLYAEEDLARRAEFTPPEILRSGLAGLMLELHHRRLPPIEEFPWVDPPPPSRIEEARRTLREIGALATIVRGEEVIERPNELARRLARLPLDPRLARIVHGGLEEGCLVEAIVIAAALAAPDPRLGERAEPRSPTTEEAAPILRDPRSDFLSLLRLWEAWSSRLAEGASSRRRWARRNRLQEAALREWTAIARQVASLVRRSWRVAVPADLAMASSPDPVRLHRAVLRGLVSGVAAREAVESGGRSREAREREGDFVTVDGVRASIWPASSLPRDHGGLVVSAELVETERRWLRTVAPVRASWVEQVAPHLLSREHFEPHWIPETGQVAAWERVRLGAVTIIPRRRVPFGPVDPTAARQVFIQEALVAGRWSTRGAFASRNARLLEELAELEARSRRPHASLREQAVFDFFERRVPPEVHSGPSFERWRRQVEAREPKLLWMRAQDVVGEWLVPDRDAFPDELVVARTGGGRLALPLRYRHAPGSEEDGITVEVPIEALGAIDLDRLDWLVPGRIEEKVAAVLRGLPKDLRVRLQPMREVAAECARAIGSPSAFGVGSFWIALSTALRRRLGEGVEPSLLTEVPIEPSLRMRVELRGDAGQVLASSRDPRSLRAQWLPESRRRLDDRVGETASLARWTRERIARLDEVPIPLEVMVRLGGREVAMHPALVEHAEGVGLRLEDDLERALASTTLGLRRLFVDASRAAIEHHLDYHPRWSEAQAAWEGGAPDSTARRGSSSLTDAVIALTAERAFRIDPRAVRDSAGFEARLEQGERELFGQVDRVVASLADAGRRRATILRRLAEAAPVEWRASLAQASERLARLDPRHEAFVAELVEDLPRCLAALESRLDRLRVGGAARDLADASAIGAFEDRLRSSGLAVHDPRARRLRRLIEELHVATFADRLGTREPISIARLERAFGEAVSSPVRSPKDPAG